MVREAQNTDEVYASSDIRRSDEYIVAEPYVVEYFADVPTRRGTGDGIRALKHDPVTDGFEEIAREAGPQYYERLFKPLREHHNEADVATLLKQFEATDRVYLRVFYEDKYGRQDIDQKKLQELMMKLSELGEL